MEEVFSSKVHVVPVTGRGVGVLAKEAIAAGEIIFRERALMTIPSWSREMVESRFEVNGKKNTNVFDNSWEPTCIRVQSCKKVIDLH